MYKSANYNRFNNKQQLNNKPQVINTPEALKNYIVSHIEQSATAASKLQEYFNYHPSAVPFIDNLLKIYSLTEESFNTYINNNIFVPTSSGFTLDYNAIGFTEDFVKDKLAKRIMNLYVALIRLIQPDLMYEYTITLTPTEAMIQNVGLTALNRIIGLSVNDDKYGQKGHNSVYVNKTLLNILRDTFIRIVIAQDSALIPQFVYSIYLITEIPENIIACKCTDFQAVKNLKMLYKDYTTPAEGPQLQDDNTPLKPME